MSAAWSAFWRAPAGNGPLLHKVSRWKLALIVAAIVLALDLTGAASAQQAASSSVYKRSGPWIISRRTHECALTTGYDGGSGLSIRLDQRLGEAALIVVDPAFRSLKAGQKFTLDVHFQSGSRLHDSYPEVTFMPLLNTDARAIAAVFQAYEFLPDLARNDAIVVLRDTAIVAKMSLAGSGAAIQILKECAAIVARENPSDPLG